MIFSLGRSCRIDTKFWLVWDGSMTSGIGDLICVEDLGYADESLSTTKVRALSQ